MTLHVALQAASLEWARTATLQLLGLGLAAGAFATTAATLYRRGTTRSLPSGVGPFFGVAAVGSWLLLDAVVRGSLVGSTALTDDATATYVLAATGLGVGGGTAGRWLGDRIACDVYGIDRLSVDDPQADRLRAARLVVPVRLPETVDVAEGYGAVTEDVERALAGSTFLLPSTLSDDQLAARVETRVGTDFDVDHVQVRLGPSGDVSSIAVGRERRGLGPELPPGTVATAIHADPAPDAAPGDPVAVWTTDGDASRLVTRGRLHSRSDDRTTVVVPDGAVSDLAPTTRYRLVTPPDAPSDRGRLLAVVRSAPETAIAVAVDRGGPLEGEFVGWLPGTALAIQRGEDVLPFPDDSETLAPDDVVFCFGHPESLAGHDGIGSDRSAPPTDAPTNAGDPLSASADG